jgi:hypothetical protein
MEQKSATLKNDLTPKQKAFLAAYSRCAHIGQAAQTAKINRQSHPLWLKESTVYRAAWDQTQELIGSMAEDAAVERRIHGVKRLVLYKGRPVLYKGRPVKVNGQPLYETEYSDPLLLAVLRKFKPEYRERTAVEHSGSLEIGRGERLIAARKRLLEFRAEEENRTKETAASA